MKTKIKMVGGKFIAKCPNCKEEINFKWDWVKCMDSMGVCPGCGQYLLINSELMACEYYWGKAFAKQLDIHFMNIYNTKDQTEKETL